MITAGKGVINYIRRARGENTLKCKVRPSLDLQSGASGITLRTHSQGGLTMYDFYTMQV